MAQDVVKRTSMETGCGRAGLDCVRIPARTFAQIDYAQFGDLQVVDKHNASAGPGAWKDHTQGRYSKGELSLISTYKYALKYAVDNQYTFPLVIMEDDVNLTETSKHDFESAIATAPPDFQVLQLYTLNSEARRQFCEIPEDWVRWMPEYYSTAMTVVANDKVAMEIATKKVTEHAVLDWWLYRNWMAYTFTKNIFATIRFEDAMNSLVPQVHATAHHGCMKNAAAPPVVAFAYVTITADAGHFAAHYARTHFPRHATTHVITHERDQTIPFVLQHKWISERRFVKWFYYRRFCVEYKHKLDMEYLLFADDDLSFRGFPWQYLQRFIRSSPSVVYSVPRESDFSNSVHNLQKYAKQPQRDFYVVANGDYWRNARNQNFNRWSEHYLRRPPNLKVSFADQSCIMMKTPFAVDFLSNVTDITYIMTVFKTDWIIDMLWCGAADDVRDAGMNACTVFPYPSWHLDNGMMSNHYGRNNERKSKALVENGFRLYGYVSRHDKYKKWLQISSEDRKLFARQYDPRFI